jgi:hypothetical protein
MEFKCDCCKYTTTKRFNYDKHLASNKHSMLEESSKKLAKVNLESTKRQPIDNLKTTEVEFTCKYCDKNFKFKQSMHRHIKYSCSKNKEDLTEVIRLLNLRLDQQEIKIKTQSEQLEKLICNLEIHDSFNTVNHIQHFHLKIREKEESPSDSELKNLFVKYAE